MIIDDDDEKMIIRCWLVGSARDDDERWPTKTTEGA